MSPKVRKYFLSLRCCKLLLLTFSIFQDVLLMFWQNYPSWIQRCWLLHLAFHKCGEEVNRCKNRYNSKVWRQARSRGSNRRGRALTILLSERTSFQKWQPSCVVNIFFSFRFRDAFHGAWFSRAEQSSERIPSTRWIETFLLEHLSSFLT